MGKRLVKNKSNLWRVKNYVHKAYQFMTVARPRLNSTLNTFLALAGLLIAVKTYRDQQDSGPKQQAALDASTKALESVVKLSKDQKTVLEKSRIALESVVESSKKQQLLINQGLIFSKEQLATLKNQWRQQQEILNRKPKFSLAIGNFTEQMIGVSKIGIKLDGSRWALIPLAIRNVGKVSAFKTNVFCEAIPNDVRISDFRGFNSQYQNEIYPNIFTYRGFLEIDIPPSNTISLPHLFYCYVLIPKEVNNFSVSFSVYSSNATVQKITPNFIIQ